jgi:PAS domain S-box-containing protein
VGYLSWQNDREAVENFASQLMNEVSSRVEQQLDSYLDAPQKVNQMNLQAIEAGFLNLNDFERIGKYFWQQQQLYDFGYINFGNTKGEFIGVGYTEGNIEIAELKAPKLNKLYSYAPDNQGNRAYLKKIYDNENPNAADWYTDAVAAGKPIWSSIYNWADFPDVLAISASAPVYDKANKLIGVIGVDCLLSNINDFLKYLKVGKSGKVFIMERSGLLVASSSSQPSYKIVGNQAQRIKALESNDLLIQKSAQYLQNKYVDFRKIKANQQFYVQKEGKDEFIQVTSYQDEFGLDWLIVVVVPEADFTTKIDANQLTTTTLGIAALVIAIVISILTGRWVTKPILILNNSAKKLAQGKWDKPIEIERNDEVGELSNSFNQMAAYLQQSFAELNELNEALDKNERKLRGIFNQTFQFIETLNLDGILLEANQTALDFAGLQLEDVIGKPFWECYWWTISQRTQTQLRIAIKRACRGAFVRYEVEILGAGDRVFTIDFSLTPIFDQNGQVEFLIAEGRDITQRKQAQKILANYNRTLETQVTNRTAELADANEQLKQEIAERQLLEGKLYSSTQQVRAIFDSITDIVLIIDEQKSIQIIPTKTISEDINSSNLLNSIVEEFFQKDSWFAKVRQVLDNQQSINFDYNLRIDNQDVWFTACLSPLADHSVVWVARDISDRKAAEVALQQQKDILQTIFDNIPVMLCFYKDGVEVQLINKAFHHTLGWSLEELKNIDIMAQCYPDPDYCASVLEFMMRADGTWRDFQIQTRVGELLETTWANIRLPDGSTVGIGQDITERKRVEQKLRESQHFIEQIANNSPQLLYLFNPTTGSDLYINRQSIDILGYTPEEILQRGAQFFLDVLHPDDLPLLERNLNYWETAADGEILITESRFRHKNGSWRWLLSKEVVFARDENNRVIKVLGTSQDISDRKQAEMALQERELMLRTLADNLPNGLIYQLVHEPNGNVYFSYITAGIERLVGIKPEAVMQDASVLHNILVEEDRLLNEQLTEKSRRDLSIFEMQMRKQKSTGEIQWSYVRSAPRRLDDGRTVWDGIEIDITNLKQTEAELAKAKEAAEAANRAKSQFLANMSHELRTPLNGILGYAQILQRDKSCTLKQQEGIDIIYQCGTHLLTLINDILDLSKIEAGKLELYPEDFHFPAFITGVLEIFQLKAAQQAIHFNHLALTPIPTLIHADEKRLRQVLINLLSNAIKFTDTGSVTFQVEVVELKNCENQQKITKIRFQVEDTGIGIKPEQIEKIFLPFEQVGDSVYRGEGTGLGLSISQKIVEMMGSKIYVESTPRVGSRFWFDLDVVTVSTEWESITVESTDNIIGYSGEPQKIMIVDDRWENRAILMNILEPIGFELEEAENGQEGIAKAIKFQPHLILADLVMPVMDGYQMVQQLRQLPKFQHTVILAISANAFEVDRMQSLDSGCNDFLAKPIQGKELLNKIKSYLNLSWIYDPENETQYPRIKDDSHGSYQSMPRVMAIPSREELLALYEAAMSGHVDGVEEESLRLQQLSLEYTPFVTRILELAADFEYEEIAKLIDDYCSEDSE